MSKIIDPFKYGHVKNAKYIEVDNVVLFFDVVGFTKGTTTAKEMRKSIEKIDNTIREVLYYEYDWNKRTGSNDLILIPTGDGYGLGFHPNVRNHKILETTRELFKELTSANALKIRLGLAKGPNMTFIDRNEVMNLFGYGINRANRVINQALENQILFDEDYAKALCVHKPVPELIEIKEPLEIKHGEEIKVYNYYRKGEFGNPKNPARARRRK